MENLAVDSSVVSQVNGLAPTPTVQLNIANPILLWNEVALEANRVSHTNGANEEVGPPLSARALAIVHLAMYDAYAGAYNNPTDLPPYLETTPKPTLDAAVEVVAAAAVAGAAHKTLVTLFPSQKPFFDFILQATGDPSTNGRIFGKAVADTILADRAQDDDADPAGYKTTSERGHHRTDPDNPSPPSNPLMGYHAPFYGEKTKVFAANELHVLKAPELDTSDYLDALREVRVRGIAPELMGTLPNGTEGRTPDQTLRGIYWGYDGAEGLGTPPRFYNQIVRRVAMAQESTVAEQARLFALVNVAMADAGILAWREKYEHNFWRPVLGIREHDESMGPHATQGHSSIDPDCDSSWLPLGAPKTNGMGKNFTPPFPAYPSGHATFGAAALHITRLFYHVDPSDRGPDALFKDKAGNDLVMVSEEFNGVNQDNHGTVRPLHQRSFEHGLWQMIIENGLSRVDLGVHWTFDAFGFTKDGNGVLQPDLTQTDVGGVPLGLAIAEDIFSGGRAAGMKKPVDVSPAAGISEPTVAHERKRIPYLPN